MADIQGKDLPLLLSDDNWTTSYTLVCLISGGNKVSFPVNKEESQCGVHTGTGAVEFSQQFSAVVNTAPAVPAGTPLVGEASYKKLLSWVNGATLLKYKVQSGASGVNFFQDGQCYLNELSLDWQVGQVAKCSGTLTGTGILDITP